jgi:sirohydrochlorin ferrochelatase
MKAVIFLAHGSRRAEANKAFIDLSEKIAEKLNLRIFEVAFIDSSLPSFQNALESCIERGADSILVYPHFLSSGVHLTRDMTAEIEKARCSHPQIEICCTPSLGEHPDLLDLVSRIVEGGLR